MTFVRPNKIKRPRTIVTDWTQSYFQDFYLAYNPYKDMEWNYDNLKDKYHKESIDDIKHIFDIFQYIYDYTDDIYDEYKKTFKKNHGVARGNHTDLGDDGLYLIQEFKQLFPNFTSREIFEVLGLNELTSGWSDGAYNWLYLNSLVIEHDDFISDKKPVSTKSLTEEFILAECKILIRETDPVSTQDLATRYSDYFPHVKPSTIRAVLTKYILDPLRETKDLDIIRNLGLTPEYEETLSHIKTNGKSLYFSIQAYSEAAEIPTFLVYLYCMYYKGKKFVEEIREKAIFSCEKNHRLTNENSETITDIGLLNRIRIYHPMYESIKRVVPDLTRIQYNMIRAEAKYRFPNAGL